MPLVAVLVIAASLVACPLDAPGDGPVTRRFAPEGRYAGHWGLDLGVAVGTGVRSPADGIVTFAGSVAGVRTVTVEHERVRTSVSYLQAVLVATGSRVRRGDLLGLAGRPHGRAGIHISVRVGAEYVDPMPWIWCRGGRMGGILRLLAPPDLYAPRRQ